VLYYALIFVGTLVAPLRFEIVLPDSIRQGEPVPITLLLTNPGPKPATVYLGGRPTAFDIVITRTDGTPVWRRLNGAVINAILQVRILAPGETLEFSDTWRQQDERGRQIKAGEYRVTGVLPSDPPEKLRTPTASLHVL
jgi:hypothetical protein